MSGSSSSFDREWDYAKQKRQEDIKKFNDSGKYGYGNPSATITQNQFDSKFVYISGMPNKQQENQLKKMGFEYTGSTSHELKIYKGPNYLGEK